VLESAPKRKKKCPHCGKFIFIREGKLVTEDAANVSDMLGRLSGLGVTQKDFDNQRKELSKKFGFTATVNDTTWKILNELPSKTKDMQYLPMIYYEMARLVSTEGKDPKPYLSTMHKIRLQEMNRAGVKTVRIVGVGGRGDDYSLCEKCKALYGKKLDIDLAIHTLPIPNLCAQDDGWCRCSYVSEEEWRSSQE